jgi:hypothetical protein
LYSVGGSIVCFIASVVIWGMFEQENRKKKNVLNEQSRLIQNVI